MLTRADLYPHIKRLLGFHQNTSSAIQSDLFHFALLSVIRMGTVHRFNLKFRIGTSLTEIAAEICFACAKAKVIAHQITDASDNKELVLWKLKVIYTHEDALEQAFRKPQGNILKRASLKHYSPVLWPRTCLLPDLSSPMRLAVTVQGSGGTSFPLACTANRTAIGET